MDITIDKKNPLEASIKITLIETDYQPKVEEKVKQYAKKADIKGFRKGMVPTSLIRKMYGKSIIVDEINHILSHALQDYIKDNNLKILGEPIPNFEKHGQIDWENQKTFDFEYEIGLVDDFNLEISPKKKVKSYSIQTDSEIIEETIANLQKQYGKMTNPEISEEGDSLYGKLENQDSSFTKDLLIDLEKVEKKVRESLIGIKQEQQVEFDIKNAFKDDETCAEVLSIPVNEAKDLNGVFKFTVRNVNRVINSPIDQELFDKVFGKDSVKTEAEFREKIQEEVEKSYKKEAERYLDQTMVDYLVEDTKIQLPDTFLKKWLEFSNEGKVSKEDIEKEYPAYVKELKWSLIKNKISSDNEIKVENEDVIEQTRELIRGQFGMSVSPQLEANMDAFVDNYLKGNNGENYMRIYNQVQSQKIFRHIRENITLQEKKVKPKEFQKVVLG